jgi:uncharacterized protein (UPF0548 family)
VTTKSELLILFSFDHNNGLGKGKASFDDARNALIMCKNVLVFCLTQSNSNVFYAMALLLSLKKMVDVMKFQFLLR